MLCLFKITENFTLTFSITTFIYFHFDKEASFLIYSPHVFAVNFKIIKGFHHSSLISAQCPFPLTPVLHPNILQPFSHDYAVCLHLDHGAPRGMAREGCMSVGSDGWESKLEFWHPHLANFIPLAMSLKISCCIVKTLNNNILLNCQDIKSVRCAIHSGTQKTLTLCLCVFNNVYILTL